MNSKTIIGIVTLCFYSAFFLYQCAPTKLKKKDLSHPITELDLKTIEHLGMQIYLQDILAAKASNILFSNREPMPELLPKGWIIEKEEEHDIVRFFKAHDGEPIPAYDVIFNPDSSFEVQELDDSIPTPKSQITQLNARLLALRNEPFKIVENKYYNHACVFDETRSCYIVYTLLPMFSPDKIPISGHTRFFITADGKKITSMEKLSSSVIEVLDRDSLNSHAITHLLSKTPIETHVFISIIRKTPLNVITKDSQVWILENGAIRKKDSLRTHPL